MSASDVRPIVLDLPRVAAAISVSKSTVQRLVREGKFPKPREISGRRVGWLTQEVEAWAAGLPVSDMLPPPNTGAPKPRR